MEAQRQRSLELRKMKTSQKALVSLAPWSLSLKNSREGSDGTVCLPWGLRSQTQSVRSSTGHGLSNPWHQSWRFEKGVERRNADCGILSEEDENSPRRKKFFQPFLSTQKGERKCMCSTVELDLKKEKKKSRNEKDQQRFCSS